MRQSAKTFQRNLLIKTSTNKAAIVLLSLLSVSEIQAQQPAQNRFDTRCELSVKVLVMARAITVDNGTEFTCKVIDEWTYNHGIFLDFIRPGRPTENGMIESINGRLLDECLNVHAFESIDDARQKLEAWRIDYNQHRPHGSLGHLTPSEYAQQGQQATSKAARI